jgi:hypothetical protein
MMRNLLLSSIAIAAASAVIAAAGVPGAAGRGFMWEEMIPTALMLMPFAAVAVAALVAGVAFAMRWRRIQRAQWLSRGPWLSAGLLLNRLLRLRSARAAGIAGTLFLLILALGGCGRDPALQATKAECEQACAHAAGLSKGRAGLPMERCPDLCVEGKWTVGEVRCLGDATTHDGAQNCPVAVKVADEGRRKAQIEEQRASIERLLVDLTEAADEAQRAAIQKQLEEARAALNKLRGVPAGGTTPPTGCTCEPGDTACSLL